MWPFNKTITTNESTGSFRDILGRALGISHKGLRNIYQIFGYKEGRIQFQTYYDYYRRQDYANRMVSMIPKSCWRDGADLVDDKGQPVDASVMKSVARTGIYQGLERADILNRLGKFSILVVGIPDGMDPKDPLGSASADRLDEVFYAAYSEDGIVINEWERDVTSPRYGLPTLYNVQMMDRGDKDQAIIGGSFQVHWSRVVHLAEGALDNEIEGLPFLEPVLNRLDDLQKTIGGSAEAYFRNARGKFALQTKDGFDGILDESQAEALRVEAEAFQNNWRDHMRLTGIEAKVLNTPVYDPEGTINGALQAIAGYSGIPIRILTGEGAGQLAGNEDKASYNQLVNDRQDLTCTPWLARVLEILNNSGMISISEEATIKWPGLRALEEDEQAKINMNNATAFKMVTDALDSMTLDGNVDPSEVYKKILGLEISVEENDDDEGMLIEKQTEEKDETQGAVGA